MWLRFPIGTTNISVERLSFSPEEWDDESRGYARFPDHCAEKVLGLNLGFVALKPANTELEDLPTAKYEAREQSELETQVQQLRTDLSMANAALSAATAENAELKLELHNSKVKVEDLEAQIEELEEAVPTMPKKK